MRHRLLSTLALAALGSFPARAADFVLLDDNRPARALMPSEANGGSELGPAWTEPTFDDLAWLAGSTGVGFDTDPGTGGDYRSRVRLDVAAMRGANASVFIRVPFLIEPAVRAQLRRLTLRMTYDDGFVAWINGVKVASALEPAGLSWNSASLAGQTHDANPGGAGETFDLTPHLGRLRDGVNTLAIQGLNAAADSPDLLIAPRLIGADTAPPVWPAPRFVEVPGAGTLDFPVAVRSAFDGSGRLFIVERRGRIRVWHRGILSTFLDLRDRVLSSSAASDERGLLGLAFPPGFGVLNRHFYVFYTSSAAPHEGDQILARYFLTASGGGAADTADPASEKVVLRLDDPFGNHNGGDLHFGPDGFLYAGLGDGGGGDDPDNRAQNPNDLWGKMLRLDTESGAPQSSTYAVPIDNPFVGQVGVRPEIWHLGLRNPWRWSFDRDTGELWIGDVGQGAWEEINLAPPNTGGLNFGWRRLEGTRLRPGEPAVSTDPGATAVTIGTLTAPVTEMPHTSGDRSAVGGYVYRGEEFPWMWGTYVHADYRSGRVYGIQPDGSALVRRTLLEDSGLRISSFGEDEDGGLYATHLESDGENSGRLYKVVEVTDEGRLLIRDETRDPASGRVRFTFGGVIGKFYQPEVSTDLVRWQASGPVLAADDVRVPFTEPDGPAAGVAPRFFRVREL